MNNCSNDQKNIVPVTIYIPVYAGERYLDECIRSALAQNQNYCRIVVLFGGGDDNSREIAAKYINQGVTLVDTSANPGMANNWNYSISLAETKYFCILHQDDQLHPKYVEELINYYEGLGETNCAMLYCDNSTLDENGHKRFYFPDVIKRIFRTVKMDLFHNFKLLLKIPIITCPTIVYKTDCARKIGLFNTEYKDALDWEYQVRAVLSGYSIRYYAKKLYCYRRHTQNETVTNRENIRRYEEIYDVYNQLFQEKILLMNKCKISLDDLFFYLKILVIKDALIDLFKLNPSFSKKVIFLTKLRGAGLK